MLTFQTVQHSHTSEPSLCTQQSECTGQEWEPLFAPAAAIVNPFVDGPAEEASPVPGMLVLLSSLLPSCTGGTSHWYHLSQPARQRAWGLSCDITA